MTEEEILGADTTDDKGSGSSRRIERKRSRGLLSFRNIALLSLVVVGGAVGYEVWRNPELVGGSKVGGAPNLDATPAGDQLRTSERYADNLRRQNEDGARQAEESGDSFVAVPDEPLRQIDEPAPTVVTNQNRPLPPANPAPERAPAETVVIERPQAPVRQQASPTPPQSAPDYTRINQLAQLMASQQQGLVQAWQAQPSGVTVVVEQDLVSQDDPSPTDLTTSSGTRPTGSAAAPANILARAGDVVLAATIITNDSDTPGPVVAEIRRGPLRGARLVGGFQPNQNNTHLIVQFDTAVLTDGTEIPISAYAVDARQKSLAVRTDLDRRLFQRYAPRVAAAFVSGLGDALSDPGTSLVDLGGVTGISRPAATFEQGVYSGLAEVGNDLAGEFVAAAPRGPLLSFFDARLVFFVALFAFHIRWWTFLLLILALAVFSAANQLNYSPESLWRLLKSKLTGSRRPAVPYTRQRPMVEYRCQ